MTRLVLVDIPPFEGALSDASSELRARRARLRELGAALDIDAVVLDAGLVREAPPGGDAVEPAGQVRFLLDFREGDATLEVRA